MEGFGLCALVATTKKIGSAPTLSGPLNITALYQSRFRVPGTGYKIALELIGVIPGGYHTTELFVVGTVAAQGVLADPKNLEIETIPLLKVG